jgi:hypothetical protein
MALAQTTEQRLFYTSGSQQLCREFSFVQRKIMDVVLLKIHEIINKSYCKYILWGE